MIKIKNVKITPEQLDEITRHLEIAADALNSEFALDWEDQNTACRNIFDALQDLKIIRERSSQACPPMTAF